MGLYEIAACDRPYETRTMHLSLSLQHRLSLHPGSQRQDRDLFFRRYAPPVLQELASCDRSEAMVMQTGDPAIKTTAASGISIGSDRSFSSRPVGGGIWQFEELEL